jgi:redox-sensitive bicupin YhaK (pirin superfamily)
MSPSIKVIPSKNLYVSEPDPRWFGNGKFNVFKVQNSCIVTLASNLSLTSSGHVAGPNPSNDDAWTNKNWLKSRFHFSFAEYSNPRNSDFGVLRVMNDDLVQPHRGFGGHPHSNMEIVTYIVEGKLTHEDSMGTEESLGRGSIQFMTAGRGVMHSEFNHGDKPLRFIQTWIKPSDFGLKPNYGSYAAKACGSERKNKLQHLVSNVKDSNADTPVQVNQDVDAYATELDLGSKVKLDLPSGRMAYLLCVEGNVSANGNQLKQHDGCEITGDEGTLEIEATGVEDAEGGKVAHVLMFTMAAKSGAGRRDDA